MSLFIADPHQNLLPYDGTLNDHGVIFTTERRQFYFDQLMQHTPWQHDQAIIYGKHIVTDRKYAWYADTDCSYRYSGITRHSLAWTPILLELKMLVEQQTQTTFNACLLNWYGDGNTGMSWHSDDEKALTPKSAIASLSLGAKRKFVFKHKKSSYRVEIGLHNGQLIVMRDQIQQHWLHALPKTTQVQEPRINLTFRHMKI